MQEILPTHAPMLQKNKSITTLLMSHLTHNVGLLNYLMISVSKTQNLIQSGTQTKIKRNYSRFYCIQCCYPDSFSKSACDINQKYGAEPTEN